MKNTIWNLKAVDAKALVETINFRGLGKVEKK